MAESEIVREMESLLAAKLDAQIQCINYYELIDDRVRKVLLQNAFDKIDALIDDIQRLDILFVSKLEQFKSLSGVKELGELSDEGRLVFIEIKKQVLKAAEYDGILSEYKTKTQALKTELRRDKIMGSQMSSAASAYNKINKL
jgi:hypothetical protein